MFLKYFFSMFLAIPVVSVDKDIMCKKYHYLKMYHNLAFMHFLRENQSGLYSDTFEVGENKNVQGTRNGEIRGVLKAIMLNSESNLDLPGTEVCSVCFYACICGCDCVLECVSRC